MSGIPLFKEGSRGFTICDQGYTIRQSDSYRILHAKPCWCNILLAVVWNMLGIVGLFCGLWYNLPALALVALALLGLMMWVYHPRKKKGGRKAPLSPTPSEPPAASPSAS